MNDASSLYPEVVEILFEVHCTKHDKVVPSSRLRHDFQMDGDDAIAFLVAIQERWGTDFSSLRFEKYFLTEPQVSSSFHWIRRHVWPNHHKKTPITVAQMVAAIESGQWEESPE